MVAETPRECGECRACCTNLGVPAIGKAAFTDCENACDEGCTIYEGRPDECRAFNCLWLAGWGPDDARPDLSGLVIENVTNSPTVGSLVQVSTTTPDDEQTEEAHFLIGMLIQEEASVVVRRKDGMRTLMATPQIKRKADMLLKRQARKKRRRTRTRIPRG